MSQFKYRAKESSGNTVEGVIEAQTHEEAVEKVNNLGYLPIEVAEAAEAQSKQKAAPAAHSISGKIKSKEITNLGRQLSSLIRAGVPVLRAITIAGDASNNPHFKDLLSLIQAEVKNGAPLSAALAQFPKLFPPLYLALVQAGEYSGTLDKTMATITDYRQKQEEISSKIRASMAYPTLMGLTGVGSIVFMLTFVMPRLMGIFSSMGESLPLPTKILISASDFIRHGWVGVLVVGAAAALVLSKTKRTKAQKMAFSLLQLQMPLMGTLALKAEMVRIAKTMEILVKSGVPVLQAIEATCMVITNEVLKDDFFRCLKDLQEGGSFGKSLRKSKWFPPFMTNLITVGEESGRLDEALTEIGTAYERETDEAIRMATSLLEPIMILVMGLIVGFIVIAMLLPIFELNMAVK